MKKIYRIIMLCVMAVALASCGGSSPEEIGPAEYKEACEQVDFIKAYSVVNKLKDKMQNYERDHINMIKNANKGWWISQPYITEYYNLKNNYEEAEHYVVLQEATYILESQGLEGITKITMIVKEHNAKWVYKDLIDIAVAMGNDEMAVRMKELAGIH